MRRRKGGRASSRAWRAREDTERRLLDASDLPLLSLVALWNRARATSVTHTTHEASDGERRTFFQSAMAVLLIPARLTVLPVSAAVRSSKWSVGMM